MKKKSCKLSLMQEPEFQMQKRLQILIAPTPKSAALLRLL
jgi:hypothetical protein